MSTNGNPLTIFSCVHPSSFAHLCFCFERLLLSNSVFWLSRVRSLFSHLAKAWLCMHTVWRWQFSTKQNHFFWKTGHAKLLGWAWAFNGTVYIDEYKDEVTFCKMLFIVVFMARYSFSVFTTVSLEPSMFFKDSTTPSRLWNKSRHLYITHINNNIASTVRIAESMPLLSRRVNCQP